MSADYEARGVAKLRARYPSQTAGLTDAGIAAAYSWWSEEVHCAGWLMMDDYTADQFATYAFKDAVSALPQVLPCSFCGRDRESCGHWPVPE